MPRGGGCVAVGWPGTQADTTGASGRARKAALVAFIAASCGLSGMQ